MYLATARESAWCMNSCASGKLIFWWPLDRSKALVPCRTAVCPQRYVGASMCFLACM